VGRTFFLIQWETEPDHQARFAGALEPALTGTEDWQESEVLRSADGARVVAIGRALMPPDIALLRGRTFAQRIVEQVDQTGVRMLEARVLLPASA
jgi:hypothetical protein